MIDAEKYEFVVLSPPCSVWLHELYGGVENNENFECGYCKKKMRGKRIRTYQRVNILTKSEVVSTTLFFFKICYIFLIVKIFLKVKKHTNPAIINGIPHYNRCISLKGIQSGRISAKITNCSRRLS